MLQTAARLLRLLTLLQARRTWSGAELAARLEVTHRTLRRDVDRLRSLGYPVQSTTGTGGGYRLGAGSSLPPLLLEDDEAMAVALGLRTAAGGTIRDLEEASSRALAKLEQVLPTRLKHRLAALHAVIVATPVTATVSSEVLTALVEACRGHHRVRYGYAKYDGTTTQREVEPHRVVHAGRRWYLVAWDLQREDWRTFRVDRLASAPTLTHRFTPRPPPDDDIAAYVQRGIASAAHPYRARVILHASLEDAAARLPPGAGVLEAIGSARCRLHLGGWSLESLAMWIALLGFEFEILDPPALAEVCRDVATRLTRASDASTTGDHRGAGSAGRPHARRGLNDGRRPK